MLSRRCGRILLHVRIWIILLSTKRPQHPDILQEKSLAHIPLFPLPICNNDAHTAQLYMAKGLLGRHHTRLLVSSHTPIHVRLVCIRHSAALCRISGIFAMVCRTTKISHSYGYRHRSGLNQHLRRIFHGTAPWRIQPIHISCRTLAYILHRYLCRMAIAAAMHQTSTQQNQSWFSRRIMHYLGTIQHGNQPIRFHDHAQHRTALSAIHIDCTRRLRIIRTVLFHKMGKHPITRFLLKMLRHAGQCTLEAYLLIGITYRFSTIVAQSLDTTNRTAKILIAMLTLLSAWGIHTCIKYITNKIQLNHN